MKELDFSLEAVKELMDKMAKTHLGVLELEAGGARLRLEAKQNTTTVVAAPSAPGVAMPVIQAETMVEEDAQKEEKPAEYAAGNTIKAPIVGTFYSSPAPDKESFVKVGQAVKKGDVLFIIESMKLMNEVQSEFDGVVSQIFVKSGEGVEFGQPIMIIQ